jgi:outer membrane immunogenic protein
MKSRFTPTAFALALSAGTALAADLPSLKGPPAYIPPPPLWTGFYAGVNAGGTWSANNSVDTISTPLFPVGLNPLVPPGLAALATASVPVGSGDGFIGGGQIGYNWQISGSFVAGVEADIQGVTRSGGAGTVEASAFVLAPFIVSTLSSTRSVDYLGTVRGRIGFLVTPTLLAYGGGGLAYGGVNSSASLFQAGTNGFVGSNNGGFSDTRVGWTAGGGAEWMFWPNWSAKLDYLYYDLGAVNYSGVSGSAFFATPAYGVTQSTTRFNGHIVRAGLNYHFNWGAVPVLAKY